MLEQLRVEGFKSIRLAEVELGAVNVFIGANGSGKSNLLEAIGLCGAALFGSVEAETLKHRGVRPGLPALYKTSFSGTRIPRLIKLACAGGGAAYRLGLDNPVSTRGRSRWLVHSETLEESGRTLLARSRKTCIAYSADGQVTLRPDPAETACKGALQQQEAGRGEAAKALTRDLIDYAIYSPTTAVLRGLAEDHARDPVGLAGSGLPGAVKELLGRVRQRSLFGDDAEAQPFEVDDLWELIDWAQGVDAVSADQAPISPAVNVGRTVLRFRDRFMASKRNTLSAYDASEGALYVLFLMAVACHPRAPRLFAVDNFDHALHPRLAARLMRLVSDAIVASGERQMLLTTHNPLVLDGLDLTDDRVRLFAVERAHGRERAEDGSTRAQGETFARRIEVTDELLAEAERGWSLSRLWVMGRLGAVPGSARQRRAASSSTRRRRSARSQVMPRSAARSP